MKTKKLFLGTLAAIICLFSLLSCSDTCETTFTNIYYEPIYTSKAEIRGGVAVEPGKAITGRGKIFFKAGYLFVNEPKNGIHVVDNRNPSNPVNVAFIKVPGSFDIVVKDDLLFTDSYMDLVTFDISDLSAIREVNRMEDFFFGHGQVYYQNAPEESRIVTDWEEEEREEVIESCDSWVPGVNWLANNRLVQTMSFDDAAVAEAGASSAPGIAGSLARFALVDNHLYALDLGTLKNLDLSAPLNPQSGEDLYVSWDVETLFPRGNELFVGAQSGMHILDITNRNAPASLSLYTHVTNCDPVIVDGDLAYVTLRSGTTCEGWDNQLEVIDISNLRSPELLHTYPMTNPHGLSKDGDALFICDGDDGLKVFNAADIAAIDQNLLAHDRNIQAYDVIAFNNIAMLIGDDGLRQYDYSDLNNIRLLSTIEIYTQ